MKISFEISDKTLIVKIAGEIDHHTACEVKEAVNEQYTANNCKDIIFDLNGLAFMDSAGIGMLIGRYKQANMNGGEVYAEGISPEIERIFYLSGLNKIIKRCETTDSTEKASDRKGVLN